MRTEIVPSAVYILFALVVIGIGAVELYAECTTGTNTKGSPNVSCTVELENGTEQTAQCGVGDQCGDEEITTCCEVTNSQGEVIAAGCRCVPDDGTRIPGPGD